MEVANRLAGGKEDIWSVVNDAVQQSSFSPVVNLGQGFFGYNPPEFVLEAFKEVVDRVDCNQYSPTRGRLRLREAIAASYSESFRRKLDAQSEVLVTTGANEGILSIIMAYVNPGDEVLIIEPHFDQFVRNTHMAGGIAKFVSLHPPSRDSETPTKAGDWKLDMAELEAAVTPRTKILILNTPHNPTGKIFTPTELQTIGLFCRSHNLLLISDEVYSRLSFASPDPFPTFPHPATAFPDLTLTVGSGGKDFAATGWRVGFVLGAPHLLAPVAAAHTNMCFAAPSGAQEALAVGYEDAGGRGYWESTRGEVERKMRAFCGVWGELGIPYVEPEGGYLVLVDLSLVQIPSTYAFPPKIAAASEDHKMCWFLINEVGVAALPPTGFYSASNPYRHSNFFRFAVCRDDDVLEVAKERLRGLGKFVRRKVVDGVGAGAGAGDVAVVESAVVGEGAQMVEAVSG